MKDSSLRLQDKNVLLVGPFCGITQSILRALTEFGASVGYISEESAGRYIEGVNEAREIHSYYGRAAHYAMPLKTDTQIQDALGQVVGTLGRMDVLIDANPLSWNASTDLAAARESCLGFAEKLVPFFLAKRRGRIIYVKEDASLDHLRKDAAGIERRGILNSLLFELSKKYAMQNITTNAVTVGVTDDFILRLNPRTPSIKRSFEELQKTNEGLKLVELNDVSMSVAYLASAMSAAVTGQVLRLTHGYSLVQPS